MRNCKDFHSPALRQGDSGKCLLIGFFFAMLAIKYYNVEASNIEDFFGDNIKLK